MREAGYFVAAVNYTTTVLGGINGPVENTKAAVRRLAEEADRFGYDPQNMGLYGVSAGGHLGLLAGSTMESDAFSFTAVPTVLCMCTRVRATLKLSRRSAEV